MRIRLLAVLAAVALLFGIAPASTRAADSNDAFNALIAAAKAEGSVVVDGPPIAAVREALTSGFQQKYGIPVTYINSGSGASGARVRAERAAGKYLLDVFISGADTPTVTFLPSGWLDKIEPALVDPSVTNPKNWRDNHLWYVDPDHDILRLLSYVSVELAVNTKLVKPKDIPTWKSLLEPKWSGKLLVKDPAAPGAGQSLTSYFYIQFGPDFVKKLYQEQKPTLIADSRQAAQFLAQGNYGVWVGADFSNLEPFVKAGYPIAPVFPSDAPGIITAAFGFLCLMNKPPHPNAAKLFVNWMASKEGEEAFARAQQGASLRTDVKATWLAPYFTPQPGRKYFDAYTWDYITKDRVQYLDKVKQLLGF